MRNSKQIIPETVAMRKAIARLDANGKRVWTYPKLAALVGCSVGTAHGIVNGTVTHGPIRDKILAVLGMETTPKE